MGGNGGVPCWDHLGVHNGRSRHGRTVPTLAASKPQLRRAVRINAQAAAHCVRSLVWEHQVSRSVSCRVSSPEDDLARPKCSLERQPKEDSGNLKPSAVAHRRVDVANGAAGCRVGAGSRVPVLCRQSGSSSERLASQRESTHWGVWFEAGSSTLEWPASSTAGPLTCGFASKDPSCVDIR